jgi:hypothetical protein
VIAPEAVPHGELVREFFAVRKAELAGFHVEQCADGTAYFFYRGKIRGKSGADSAPRGLIVVESTGEIRPIREIGSWERKKLRHMLKRYRTRK